jgi:hypothetical protein
LVDVPHLGLLLAAADEPIAVITELKPNRGQVQIKLPGKQAWEDAAPLQSLYRGSQIRASEDALAVILFMDGARPIAVEEKDSPYELRAPLGREEGGTAARLKGIASYLLGKKNPPTYVPLAVRGAKPPTPLSPRNTTLLSTTPTFHWMGTPGAQVSLFVNGPEGLVWKVDELKGVQLSYPSPAPLLKAGVEYHWGLETREFPPQWAKFKTLDADAAGAMHERLRSVQEAGLPKTTQAVLQASLLLNHELFHEAREVLAEAVSADPDEPSLHLLLGEVYEKTGLPALAANEYDKAESLAKGKR